MGRLNIFVKGNVDVHDSLHSCTIGGALRWNGINEVLRSRYPGMLARTRHETWTRSDALLEAKGSPPEALIHRNLPLVAYPLTSQFSNALFETTADAYVLSVQTDITTGLMRHKTEDYLLYPDRLESWPELDKAWLRENFDRLESLSVAESMNNFSDIVERIRSRTDAPVLVFNLSPIVPGEHLHCYQGMDETFSTRVRRFNLALTELSEATGISIIDVEALVARGGADTLKLDALHLSPLGYEIVAVEVANVLADCGLLPDLSEAKCALA